MAVGIAAYACYFPHRRHLGVPVAGPDEDALTMAVAAARPVASAGVTSLGLAATTLPYALRVQAGLIAASLGLSQNTFVTEHTASDRAGTEAVLAQLGQAALGSGEQLVVAAHATGPGMAAGAVALRLAADGAVAQIDGFASYTAEDPGLQFVRSGESDVRDVQVPDYTASRYLAAMESVSARLLSRLGRAISQYRHLVLTGPTAALIARAAGKIGAEQARLSLDAVPGLGDTGPVTALRGLVAALDHAAPEDLILVISYGAGSAADAISLRAGPQAGQRQLDRALAEGREIDGPEHRLLKGGC